MSVFGQTVTTVKSLEHSAISVDPKRILSAIDEKIYAGFVEHLGRCIYGGLVDYSENPKCKVNELGYRQDVSQAIKDLNMPVVRWPGGNFVSSYHWIDGVGPKEDRPRRPELAWKGEESNEFGTNEFMEWCRYMDVEPYFCLNMGTGTLDEALGWVEYCNSSANTYYANLRRKHGHPEPYNIKYWGLGNEVWGPWQVGQMSQEEYSTKAAEWAKAIKLLDPNVQLVSCGCTGIDNWDHYVLDKLINWVDFHSIHMYTANDDFLKNVTAPVAAEAAIQVTKGLIDLATTSNPRVFNGLTALNGEKKKVKICFDEWNVWDPERADGVEGAEERYTLSDAIAVASWLNIFVRQSESLGMCNIAQVVNVIAPIMTNESTMFLQTTYHPFRLFSNYMRGNALNLHVETTMYEGEAGNNSGQNTWIKGNYGVPLLDASAVQNGDKTYIAVVNRCDKENAHTKISFTSKVSKVHKWLLYDDDVFAYNSFEEPEKISVKESDVEFSQDINNAIPFTFAKHSFTLLEISY
ncbi:alpha-L-arabinofuranosidase [Yamadazyma tenuis]|uniref:non-reducing end alpha-L-arabinofuranosidase n=1 Tax=Candida tenuis (strain ATCC 10573 / BCRC 21748 / CBS 615 / JCM 9827 / NBRC 10315 / NRRL Y-1498 / VKM Y-70) TaxID=590646 RepID=G3AZI9_CANTC|nr:glycoside hydrolase [Yamadazyma tenuis ATCC 10573]EGV65589.1 glycoside hydrolase [Yamadazyma tenuis ATCC 10573]WEJ96094.1 alpha-L-arabinofuranosidase [Yamadazyma tenuis]